VGTPIKAGDWTPSSARHEDDVSLNILNFCVSKDLTGGRKWKGKLLYQSYKNRAMAGTRGSGDTQGVKYLILSVFAVGLFAQRGKDCLCVFGSGEE